MSDNEETQNLSEDEETGIISPTSHPEVIENDSDVPSDDSDDDEGVNTDNEGPKTPPIPKGDLQSSVSDAKTIED